MDNLPSEAASNPQTIQFAIAEAGPSSVGDARGEDPQPEQPAASQAGSPATTVDYIDLLGETALHHAAKRGELESVRKLTHTHANVGIRDNDGLLAAQIACIGSHWDIMEYLFDIDEDNTLINEVIAGGEFSGSTCLHVAVKRNAWKAVRYLAANMEVDTLYRLDNDGLTAWDLACGRSKLSRGRDHKKQSLPFGGAPLSSIAHNSASSIGAHSTGSAQSTGQRVSYHPSFPVNLEVSCILLARDSQINRAEFQYPLWEEREISGINCWLLPKNHLKWLFAVFGELLLWDAIRAPIINRFRDSFQYEQFIPNEENSTNVTLKLREPSCTTNYSDGSKSFTITMPYFRIQTRSGIKKWRVRTHFEPELEFINRGWTISAQNYLETLISPYVPLTLDEYCYPTLPIALRNRRNDDQVLLRATRKQGKSDPSLITVCQLWIVESRVGLVAAYENDLERQITDVPNWALDCVTNDKKRCIGIILSYFIDGLDRPYSDGSGEPILDTFEKSVAEVVQEVDEYSRGKEANTFDIEKERIYLHHIEDIRAELGMIRRVILQQEEVWKAYVSQAWPTSWNAAEGRLVNRNEDYIILPFSSSYSSDDDDGEYDRKGKSERREEKGKMREHKNEFYQSSSPSFDDGNGDDDRKGKGKMREHMNELYGSSSSSDYEGKERGKMRTHARFNQRRVRTERESASKVDDEWQAIMRAQSQFDRYRRRITQLDEDVQRMENSIMIKLDLKQKHASLRESHATAVMSAAVLGFTVITIIFTPLSFLTSLFALPIERFQANQVDFFIPGRKNEADFTNRTRAYTTNYIGTWTATAEIVSVVIALISMWLVIEYGLDVPVTKNFRRWLTGWRDEETEAQTEAHTKAQAEGQTGAQSEVRNMFQRFSFTQYRLGKKKSVLPGSR